MIPIYATTEYLDSLTLIGGVGNGTAGQRCAMQEVRAWLDLDAASDEVPACVCPVIGRMVIGLNDAAPATRATLRFRLPAIIGTRGSDALSQARACLARDWLVRVYLPAWLDLVPSLAMHAAALRALPEIVGLATAEHSNDAARAAAEAARAAARAAAGDAARAAAGAAAWEATRAAVGHAAGDAAGDAAGAAAWAAVWDVVRDVAWAAARDTLAPTVETLQHSALALLDRMLALPDPAHAQEDVCPSL